MKKVKYIGLSLAVALAVTGCSGGGDIATAETRTEDTAANTISLSGVAVDGYISGAKVCIDINSDGICQNTEPTTTTATDGTFSFANAEVADNLLLPVIVSGGTDTATGNPFEGELKNIIDSATITAVTPLSVTPLTDLIATSFLLSPTKDITTLDNSKVKIAEVFGLSVAEVVADPMKSVTVFAKTQEVQQIKALLEITANKAKGTTLDESQTTALQNDIKTALIGQIKETAGTNLEIDKVLEKVETQASITIPENEKAFVGVQIVEVKKKLDTLATTGTTPNELDELQAGLETEQEVALTKIKDAIATDTLVVVTISDVTVPVKDTAPTVAANSGFSTPPTTPTY